MFQNLSSLDIFIIFAYFIGIFLVAFFVTMRDRKKMLAGSESTDYFLAGRNAGWLVIGASLFASNIGSEHIVGLVGSGARGDMPNAQFEVLASLMLILLGWLFVPFYLKSGVFTMPEFLERRYSEASRTYLSIVSILAYIMTKISLTIFAGALIFQVVGVPFWTGAIIVVLATGLYTVLGGLRAVIYTDLIQMFVLIAGSTLVTYYGLEALGGWNGMTAIIDKATAESAELSDGQFFNLWRPHTDPDYPWTGMVFGAPILGIWYWCTDQFIVQRALSARNISQARKGTIFAGFLKQLPLFIFVVPGIIAFALVSEGLLTFASDDADQALPAMITHFLPSGVRGLMLAGLLAALMSSLSSVFNSCSTLITMDFYQKWRPESTGKELVRAGQIATGVLVILSLGWIPFMKVLMGGGGIFNYLQSVQAYISPPIAAAFLFGLFFKRLNAKGAIWGLWSGFALGMLRLVLEYMTKEGVIQVEPGGIIAYFVGINFLHYAIILFVVSAAVFFIVSMLGEQQPPEKLFGVTYEKSTSQKAERSDVWLTVLLVAFVIMIWVVFSPWGIG